ncbi:hypothetical protein HNR61_007214 [Actinomadura namibiensis]|uniref:Uncharacterized protein n=1 Tax=Actinomadura namibiensis TaxID=182080 RepID=A0A7W3LWD6_ACTNM|nr:hypothetical protein [Actinomadura namibiensis]MBA8955538.1 hypothetical protein [Actinomadura namibiensis]
MIRAGEELTVVRRKQPWGYELLDGGQRRVASCVPTEGGRRSLWQKVMSGHDGPPYGDPTVPRDTARVVLEVRDGEGRPMFSLERAEARPKADPRSVMPGQHPAQAANDPLEWDRFAVVTGANGERLGAVERTDAPLFPGGPAPTLTLTSRRTYEMVGQGGRVVARAAAEPVEAGVNVRGGRFFEIVNPVGARIALLEGTVAGYLDRRAKLVFELDVRPETAPLVLAFPFALKLV